MTLMIWQIIARKAAIWCTLFVALLSNGSSVYTSETCQPSCYASCLAKAAQDSFLASLAFLQNPLWGKWAASHLLHAGKQGVS